MSKDIFLEDSWKSTLQAELGKEYVDGLFSFVLREYKQGTVYPAYEHMFRAFELTPFEEVNVVILGQDPYHGENQATGLAFSVPDGTTPPPSLRNIAKELEDDTGGKLTGTSLTTWTRQGVLLLNSTLTVRASTPGSHQKKGWEQFTDAVIQAISDNKEHVVFILWGNYAKDKGALIDRTKHFVIESAHPSPFSARNGFFGSRPFSKTNEYLVSNGKTPIEWT